MTSTQVDFHPVRQLTLTPMDKLTGLAEDAGSDDPYAALRGIVRLRTELDKAETIAVRRARNAGYSWQLIALALGVSKQALMAANGKTKDLATRGEKLLIPVGGK